MSVWDYNSLFEQDDKYGNPRQGIWRYTKWADPFKKYEQEVETLACEGELLATFKAIGISFGQWAWTQFIPSPFEIFRKTVAGGYRCGFYLGIKFKSPAEIIFRSQRLGRTIAKINGLATTPLFYFWVAQTLWSFLNTWTSLIHAMYRCDADQNTCIAGIMVTQLATEGDHEGTVAAGLDIYDPNDWHEGLSGDIFVPEGRSSTCHIALNITSFGMSADSLQFYLGVGEFPGGSNKASDSFSLGMNETNEVYLAAAIPAGGPTHWRCGLIATGLSKFAPLSRIDIGCVRMVVRSSEQPIPCDTWTPSLPALAAE